MGDRANAVIITNRRENETPEQVWLYTHWTGCELPELVFAGVKAARPRWTDYAYAAKIITGEVIPPEGMKSETGYGISGSLQDNSYPILIVDLPRAQVYTIPEDELDDAGRVPDRESPPHAYTLEQFAALKTAPTWETLEKRAEDKQDQPKGNHMKTASNIYSPQELEPLPTLYTGQCCSLKIDTGKMRVWLCRVAGGVTIERYHHDTGRWETAAGDCTDTGGEQ